MANNSYKNSISLGIRLQSSKEIQSELNSLIKELEKNSSIDLKIDTKQINQSLKDFSENLNNISNQIKNNFNFGSTFNTQASGIEKVTNKLKEEQQAFEQTANTMKTLSSTTIGKSDSNGNITEALKTVEQLQASIGNTTRLTTDLKTGLHNASNTENFAKIEKEVNNLQTKLSKFGSNKFINDSVITDLQKRLDGINTNTAESEFKELKSTINNLSSNDSQIIRLQNEISKLGNNLTSMRGKYSGLVGDSSSRAELNSYIAQIENLKKILASLKSGGTISGQKLASELNLGTNASRELSNAVKNSSNALKLTTVDSESFGQSIKKAFSNAGLYMGTYQAINMVTNALKNGIKTIIDIDTQMRDLAKVSNATTEQLSKFSAVANKIAIGVGTSTEAVISATTYYSKLGYSIEEASKRAEKATIFSNVADMNIDDASKALITIQKGFDLNSLKDMNRVMDVANAVGNNYSSTSQNVAEGLRRMGNAMKEAGNSYEQSVGLFVAGNASVQDAEVVGNAIKTITMRLRGMKTEIDETGIPASKLRQAIKDITASGGQEVDIMKDNNTFKSTYEQMTELSQVYPKLTDAQRSYLQYVIAGQRQGNIFSGMMVNMKEGMNAYTTALNSSGSAMREQQIFMDSIEGKLNKLKETFKQFWVATISSSSVKNTVDVLTKLVSAFGNLPTIIGLATTAFLVFKGQAISSAIGGLVSYASTLVTVTKSTGALKLATAELDIALSTNPFGLIAIAITGVIVAMDLYNESIQKVKQSNADYVQSLQNKSPNQGQELLDNYKRLQTELSNLKKGTQEYKAKEEELANAQQSLITLYPQASSAIDENTGKKKLNADATQGLIDKEKQYAQAQATKVLSDNDIKKTEDIQKIADAYTKAKGEMEKYQQMYNNGERTTSVQVKTPRGIQYAKVDISSEIEKSRVATEGYEKQLEATKGALGQLNDRSGAFAGSLKIIDSSLANNTNNIQDNTEAKKDNANAKDDIQNQANAEQEQADAVAKATEEYQKSTQTIAKAQGYIDKLNKSQAVTPQLAGQISKSYEDIGININNLGSTVDFLKNKIQEQQEAQENALMIMKGNDADFYKEKVANNQEYENQINDFLSRFTGNSQQAYNVDLSQFTTLNQMKSGVQNTLKSAVDSFMKQFVDTSAEGYKVDYSNFSTLINAKKEVMKQMAGSMASFWDETAQAFNGQAYGGMDLSGHASDSMYKEYQDKAQGILNLGSKIKGAMGQLDGVFAGGGLNFKGFDGGGISDFSGTGGGDSSKKAEQEAIKAEKEALDELTDAYDKAKSIIEDDINAIDTKLEDLGDTNSDNFVQKIDLTNQKLAKQQEEVKLASDQLQKLKDTSFDTAEGQDALEKKILSANKELRSQTLEASKLHKELEKLEEDQLKKYYENQKEIETQKLDATQQAQNDKLDEIKQEQEDIHNTKMDYFDAELKALEEQNEAEDKSNELQEKQNDLKQKQIDLERIRNQGDVQTYSKDANGNWGFGYTYNKDNYDAKQKEVEESKKSLEETKRKQEYEEEKKAIEDQKTAEEKLYKEKEDYLEKYSKTLKEQQDRDKKRIETYYSDIDTLTRTTLKTLEEQYNNNWTAIANSISTSVDKSKKEIESLQTLSSNFVASDVVKGILSGDVSGFIRDNQNKMNQQANVDENEIDNYFKNIDASANNANDTILKLSDSYKSLSTIKEENLNITDDDLKQNKKQVSNITKIDYDGLAEQLKNLKEINAQIEKELDTHYNNELTRQNQAQTDEIASHDKFAKEYLLKTNKLCELLQVVWDFRFSNIVEIVDNAGVIISQALEAWGLAYQKFAIAWNKMHDKDHQIANKIEFADALSSINGVHTTVVQWENDKTKLYDQKTFDEFSKNIQGNIQDSLLNKLNNYSGAVGTSSTTSNSSTVNKNNTSTSNTTNLYMNQVDVNTKDAQNLLSQLVSLVSNKTNLS